MNRSELLKILLVALAAGAVAFAISQRLAPSDDTLDEVSWVIQEFDLTDAQAAKVRELHAAYRPICDAHCDAVMQAQRAVDEANTDESRMAAEQELAALKDVCHDATLEHLHAVADVMSPEQGRRFLAKIVPLLSSHGHSAPFGLR